MYVPSPPPSPTTSSVGMLVAYVYRELQNVASAFSGVNLDYMALKTWHAAPPRAFEGMLVLADGTNWNPTGSGGGLHAYRGGAWVRIG